MHRSTAAKQLQELLNELLAQVREEAKGGKLPTTGEGWWAWRVKQDQRADALQLAIEVLEGK